MMAAMKPIIGITCDAMRGAGDAAEAQPRCMSPRGYARAVAAAGGVPMLLPHTPETIPDVMERCDGIILTGGDDPDTTAFGEPVHPRATLIDPDRQAFELALLQALDDRDSPALGICLGMQLMALHHGGRLHQHLPDVFPAEVADRHREGDHEVIAEVADDPLLPERAVVHSRHHQAVVDAGAMRICGRSDDGVIEAVDLPDRRFYLGVQWHPERTAAPGPGMGLMRRLIDAARQQ